MRAGGGTGDAPGRGKPSADYTGRPAGLHVLADTFGELARQLQGERDLDHTLVAIVRAATDTVPGAEQASISAVLAGREVSTLAATAELARRVDQAQYDTGEGPCLSSLYDQRTVRLPDMAAEPRWPGFAARALGLGVRSMLAVQLYVTGQRLGALNLHSSRVDAFGDESEQVALLFAAHAAVALAGAAAAEQMRHAVDSRDLIGQAKGILIERYKVTGQEAFRLLVVASQATNIKLVEVALYLVETGQLAAVPEPRG